MQQFWWVNHNKTFRQEVGGQYLWSPKRESDGRKNQFYDNMRVARPGEFVVSYSQRKISCIGKIADYAIHAPKPEEFKNTGDYWSQEGWLLPVIWYQLDNPVFLPDIFDDIKDHLPKKYSPINPNNGNGNQKAYLANIDQSIFDHIAAIAGFSSQNLEENVISGTDFVEQVENKICESILTSDSLSDTEKLQVTKSRVGQGQFKNNIYKIEAKCRVTGINNPLLLIASHIKPWRSCINKHERLDGYNGLLLSPHADFLFDKGFISFLDSGDLLFSQLLENSDIEKLGIRRDIAIKEPFLEGHLPYLEYHRNEIFMP